MNPEWMKVAVGEIGVTEMVGRNHNPRILEYHAETGLSATDDETSWCGSYAAWSYVQAGIDISAVRNQAAAARAWLNFGVKIPKDKLIYGCQLIFWRESPSSWKGHTGFFHSWANPERTRINVLGGNQRNRVEIMSYPAEQLLGARWPKEIPLPAVDQGLKSSGVLQGATVAGAGTAAVIVDSTGEILDGLQRADREVSVGTTLSYIAAFVILAGLVYVIVSRLRGAKELRKIGDNESMSPAKARTYPSAGAYGPS